ncbi:MAG: hypothetical protein FD167_2068 [bacterium]|nr:MAG: hypothetical protein FD167_2068 [bacterium]
MKDKRVLVILLVILLIIGFSFYYFGRGIWYPQYLKVVGKRTVSDVVKIYGDDARDRLKPYFERANVSYPPQDLVFVGLKEEKTLEVWAKSLQDWKLIQTYPIKAASGKAGPKLREGDRQVPEGIYKIISLNPNSSYHLSMKINYPNESDLQHAKAEGREHPGGNIFIHGKAVSIGCLAMGDEAIEELFFLVSDVGKVKVLLTPYDFRKKEVDSSHSKELNWIASLYKEIDQELKVLK